MSSDCLFEFEPLAESGRARLSVDLSARCPHPVERMLYGKFCEHLGYNIYGGMEAQILHNATFGQIKGGEGLALGLARRMGWPDGETVAASFTDGAAIGWFRLGSKEQVLLSPDAGPHGSSAQRFETPGASAASPLGIGQWTYLPLHRTGGYELRVVARAVEPCRIELSLSPVDSAGKAGDALARTTMDLTDDWATLTGRLDVPRGRGVDDKGVFLFAVTAAGAANIVIDRVLLYPDDHVNGADAEIIALLKEAALPILRWPGGNFVSAYDWPDGVGAVDARRTDLNPVWGGMESNLFGTDEFIAYCREVGCEPLICVNAGNGTAAGAAAWVEYCNGSPDTPMGRLRAENGHREPFGVKYWEIGNEIFGRHQTGWTTPGGNVDRFMHFGRAMRAADPSIRLLACGGLHLGVDHEWNRRLTNETDGGADCQTHHILEGGTLDDGVDPGELFDAFMAYPIQIGREYRQMRERMLEAGIADPHLAITELQLFASRPHRPPGDDGAARAPIPTPATISEALYATLIVHECIRLGDFVEMLTHSATVNHGGGLRKDRQRVWANPVHHAHAMGVELAGGTPLGVALACGTFSTAHEFGHLPAVEGIPDLDAMAVLAEGGEELTLMLVHRSSGAGPVELAIDLGGFVARGRVEILTLAGETLADENTYAEPERVVPQSSSAEVRDAALTLTLAPYSLTRVRIAGRSAGGA